MRIHSKVEGLRRGGDKSRERGQAREELEGERFVEDIKMWKKRKKGQTRACAIKEVHTARSGEGE
jgi:hypothetical protein